MVLMENRQVVLTSRPSGIPQAENFAIRQGAMPAPASGEILVRNHYLSIEPAMRGWISDAGNYSDPVPIGGAMRSLAAAQVVDSLHPDYKRSEEHTSELQSLMRISYAVFCLKKKKNTNLNT